MVGDGGGGLDGGDDGPVNARGGSNCITSSFCAIWIHWSKSLGGHCIVLPPQTGFVQNLGLMLVEKILQWAEVEG